MTTQETLTEDFSSLDIKNQYEIIFNILDGNNFNDFESMDHETRCEFANKHGDKLRIIKEANLSLKYKHWTKEAVIEKCVELERNKTI